MRILNADFGDLAISNAMAAAAMKKIYRHIPKSRTWLNFYFKVHDV
jgi:hypothetical protein